ncbi:MAG: KpsF/GutQ family sugar-phosphate isomerase [Gammaproteobacteria bacterium]|nr:KpsF/GutQ family sugar-phosphate isomerase [Gammaproteobacteria bacterium]MDH5801550.1 KpsF/GutQ family sugar-phosphate isomerase [Gammaproteobacteria bacterium]
MNQEKLITLAKAVIENEAKAIEALSDRIDEDFFKACSIMHACHGRIVVMGMGKSGHIGGKIAATLASTGSPAFFVHPGEASHGDMGMITQSDVVLAFSNSGETDEISTLLPLIKRKNVPLIALTGNVNSSLARAATVHIDVSVEKEACPLGLAPTTSTTAALAMGDALAIALLESKGFTADDFALSHPGGQLGRRLLLKVDDIMHSGTTIPKVSNSAMLSEALMEMTRKGLGMTTVVDTSENLLGIFTDGDLRRVLDHGDVNVHNIKVTDVMTSPCKKAELGMLAVETLRIMDQYKINSLPVVDAQGQVVGAMNMHDLLKAGVV